MTWRIGECYLIGDCCDDPRGRVHADIVTERGDSVASAARQFVESGAGDVRDPRYHRSSRRQQGRA
jgi:hypothetical protein